MTYVRQTQEEYQAKMRAQQLRSLKKKARQRGVSVIEDPPTEAAAQTSASP